MNKTNKFKLVKEWFLIKFDQMYEHIIPDYNGTIRGISEVMFTQLNKERLCTSVFVAFSSSVSTCVICLHT